MRVVEKIDGKLRCGLSAIDLQRLVIKEQEFIYKSLNQCILQWKSCFQVASAEAPCEGVCSVAWAC